MEQLLTNERTFWRETCAGQCCCFCDWSVSRERFQSVASISRTWTNHLLLSISLMDGRQPCDVLRLHPWHVAAPSSSIQKRLTVWTVNLGTSIYWPLVERRESSGRKETGPGFGSVMSSGIYIVTTFRRHLYHPVLHRTNPVYCVLGKKCRGREADHS
jgi:hypothetical protein